LEGGAKETVVSERAARLSQQWQELQSSKTRTGVGVVTSASTGAGNAIESTDRATKQVLAC
jgi:hypothetical protein